MYIRFLHLKSKPGKADALQSFYAAIAIPELQKISGCLFAGLINSSTGNEEYISLTIWEDNEAAKNYAKGEVYSKLVEQGKAFIEESSEWKIQLGENMELEYAPVSPDPEVKEYQAVVETDPTVKVPGSLSSIYVRMVTHKIRLSKKEEFIQIYNKSVIPFFKNTTGCLFASLIESTKQEDEVISMTIWDSKEKMESYENGGDFEALLAKLQPTFSHFFQWKVEMEKQGFDRIQTNKDIKIQTYKLITGKKMD